MYLWPAARRFNGDHLVKKLTTKDYELDIIDNLSNRNSHFSNELVASGFDSSFYPKVTNLEISSQF
jgi:hypothetical protein